MKKKQRYRFFAFILNGFLICVPLSLPDAFPPQTDTLAPKALTLTKEEKTKLDKERQFAALLNAEISKANELKELIDKIEDKKKRLQVDPKLIQTTFKNTKKEYFPYIVSTFVEKEGKLQPVEAEAYYHTAVEILRLVEDKLIEDKTNVRFFVRHLLGSALYLAKIEKKEVSRMLDLVVNKIDEAENRLPQFIEQNPLTAQKYSSGEYAALLEAVMIPALGLSQYNGDHNRWNEKSKIPSEIPSKLKKLENAKESAQINAAIEALLDEYQKIDAQFDVLKRGEAVKNEKSEVIPQLGDTVIYPKKGEKTAVPLGEGVDPEKFVDDLFKRVAEEYPDTKEFKYKNQIQAAREKVLAEIISGARDKNSVILSRESLDLIGSAMLLLNKYVSIKSFGGKGTRFAERKYEIVEEKGVKKGKRVPNDKAKGGYTVEVLGNKTIIELVVQSHQDIKNALMKKILGLVPPVKKAMFSEDKKKSAYQEKLPQTIIQSHLTEKEQIALFEKKIQMTNGSREKIQGATRRISLTQNGSKASDFETNTVPALPLVMRSTGAVVESKTNPKEALWPDGHNSAFIDFFISGSALHWMGQGVQYAYVSNGDNMAALPQPAKVAMLALSGRILMNDVAEKPKGEKGGSLINFKNGAPVKVTEVTGVLNTKILVEGWEMPHKFMEVIDEVFKFVANKTLEEKKKILLHPKFIQMAEDLLGTEDLKEEIFKNKKLLPLEEASFFANRESKPGTINTKFKLFNTANYLFDIQKLMEEGYGIGWDDYQSAVKKAEYDGDRTDLEKIRWKMKSKYPTVFEEDKTFKQALQINQLAGAVTAVIPNEETLYLEVPTGFDVKEESLFQPLKSNIANSQRDLKFLEVLRLEEDKNTLDTKLTDCLCPETRKEDLLFMAEYREWTGREPHWREGGEPDKLLMHDDFKVYREKVTLGAAFIEAEKNLTKHQKELISAKQVLDQYKDTPLKRIAHRKKHTASVIMATDLITVNGEEEPAIFYSGPANEKFEPLFSKILSALTVNGLDQESNRLYILIPSVVDQKKVKEKIEELIADFGLTFTIIRAAEKVRNKNNMPENLIKVRKLAERSGVEQLLILMNGTVPDISSIGKVIHLEKDYAVLFQPQEGHSFWDQNKSHPLFYDETKEGKALAGVYLPFSELKNLEQYREDAGFISAPSGHELENISQNQKRSTYNPLNVLPRFFPKDKTVVEVSGEKTSLKFNLSKTVGSLMESLKDTAIFLKICSPFGFKSKGLFPKELAENALKQVDPDRSTWEDPVEVVSAFRKSVFRSKNNKYIVEIFGAYSGGDHRFQTALHSQLVYGIKSPAVYFYDNDLRIIVQENLDTDKTTMLDTLIVQTPSENEAKVTDLMKEVARYIYLLQRKGDKGGFNVPGTFDSQKIFAKEPVGFNQPWHGEMLPNPTKKKDLSTSYFDYLEEVMLGYRKVFQDSQFSEKINQISEKTLQGLKPKDPDKFYLSHGALSPWNMTYYRNGQNKYHLIGVSGGDLLMSAPAERDLAVFIVRFLASLKQNGTLAVQNFEHFNRYISSFLNEYYQFVGLDEKAKTAHLERLNYFILFSLYSQAWYAYFDSSIADEPFRREEANFYLQVATDYAKNLAFPKDKNFFQYQKREGILFQILKSDPVKKEIVIKEGESAVIEMKVKLRQSGEQKPLELKGILERIIVILNDNHKTVSAHFSAKVSDQEDVENNYSFKVTLEPLTIGTYNFCIITDQLDRKGEPSTTFSSLLSSVTVCVQPADDKIIQFRQPDPLFETAI